MVSSANKFFFVSGKITIALGTALLCCNLLPANADPTGQQPLQGEVGKTDAAPLKGEVGKSGTTSLKGEVGKSGTTQLKGEVGKSGSTPLKGEVGRTGAVLPAAKLHMSKDELKAAVQQYSNDLRDFYLHANQYHDAQVALKKQIGECTENEQQWQLKLKQDRLNLNAVVIPVGVPNLPPPPAVPVIQPPRVCCIGCLITGRCGHLGTGGGGMAGPANPQALANANRMDAIRAAEASANLARKQGELNIATQENNMTSQKAIDEAKIQASQQNLAEKFGQLQEEYKTLKIEKEALTGVKVQ